MQDRQCSLSCIFFGILEVFLSYFLTVKMSKAEK